MAKKQEKNDSYKVGTGTGDIKLSVDVGLAQLGAVKISLDKKPLFAGAAPVGMQNVGTRAAVKGKLLIVETMVTDVSTQTNKMSVVLKLSGGPSSKTITVNGEVTEAGESILFQNFVLLKE